MWRVVAGVVSTSAWLGVVWAVVFYRWFRDAPGDHPSVKEAERALLAGNPAVARHARWRRFLGSRTTWAALGSILFFQLLKIIHVTWLPKFLKADSYGADSTARCISRCWREFRSLPEDSAIWWRDASCHGSPRAWAPGPPGASCLKRGGGGSDVDLFVAHHLDEPIIRMEARGSRASSVMPACRAPGAPAPSRLAARPSGTTRGA